MTFLTVQRVLGILLTMFALTMLPPLGVALFFADQNWDIFAASFGIVLSSGLLLWWPVRKYQRELRIRDGFIVVALYWGVLGLSGALPLILAGNPSMTFTDAVFESVSGLTTTGATVLQGLDALPPSLLYYRQQLQWFGGLGIVVLAVAVLPMLGVGGMQLYRAEVPGPVKDMRLTPRITQTAKALWYVYFGITVLCAIAYKLGGMTVFDAIGHSFTTVATGGFSTHDASLAHFNSPLLEWIAIFFMFVAGVNFSLHFVAWRDRGPRAYVGDAEFNGYFWIVLCLSAVIALSLLLTQHYVVFPDALRDGTFQLVSFITTTGFVTETYAVWPIGLPVLLIFASFIGGCGGSTSGSIKVMRWLLMYKQGSREFQRLVHPNAEIAVKLGGKVVHSRIVDAVWGFFAVYVVVFVVLMLVMLSAGLDQVSAFSAVAATLNNLGPGLGEVNVDFNSVNNVVKWASVCAMLLGRLEIFALLVLVTPTFWRG